MGMGYWCGPDADLLNMVQKLPKESLRKRKNGDLVWQKQRSNEAYKWKGKSITRLTKPELFELVMKFIKVAEKEEEEIQNSSPASDNG